MTNETKPTEPTQENKPQGAKPEPPDIPAGTDTDSQQLEKLKSTNTAYENALRSILGIEGSEEMGDISKRLSDYNSSLEAKAAAVNDKIIAAEIKSLQGYDTKLLARVIDKSNIKVADDGTVTGLSEAVKAAEKEFPAVVVKQDSKPYAPYNPAGTGGTQRTMNDIIRNKRSY